MKMIYGRVYYDDGNYTFLTPADDQAIWEDSPGEIDELACQILDSYEAEYKLYPHFLVEQLHNSQEVTLGIVSALDKLAR